MIFADGGGVLASLGQVAKVAKVRVFSKGLYIISSKNLYKTPLLLLPRVCIWKCVMKS